MSESSSSITPPANAELPIQAEDVKKKMVSTNKLTLYEIAYTSCILIISCISVDGRIC